MVEALAAVTKSRAETRGGKAADHGVVEAVAGEAVARIGRAAHQLVLQALDIDPAVLIGGVRHARVGRCEATYYTLAGSVIVKRSLYRSVGQRNAKVALAHELLNNARAIAG